MSTRSYVVVIFFTFVHPMSSGIASTPLWPSMVNGWMDGWATSQNLEMDTWKVFHGDLMLFFLHVSFLFCFQAKQTKYWSGSMALWIATEPCILSLFFSWLSRCALSTLKDAVSSTKCVCVCLRICVWGDHVQVPDSPHRGPRGSRWS